MNRRDFLKRAAIAIAAGVAVDQLELLERLAPKRLWAGHSFAQSQPYGISGFSEGDHFALMRDGVSTAFGVITAVDAKTGVMTIDYGFDRKPTNMHYLNSGDYLIRANAMDHPTIFRAGTGRRL